jgi:dihydrodipicolinate synthase/N-acetylneuraminate lyase
VKTGMRRRAAGLEGLLGVILVTPAVYQVAVSGKLEEAYQLEARLRAVQAAFRTGTSPAACQAAIAAAGIGEPWLAPPRQPLDEEQTAGLIKRLTALHVL